MLDLANQSVLVIGLGGRGRAACELLSRTGARVVGLDSATTDDLRSTAAKLRPLGVEVELGASALPKREFTLAVVSPGVPASTPLVKTLAERNIPTIGELELGFQQSRCLSIAVAGTNGKGTTAELIEAMLTQSGRKTILSGHGARPVCAVADQTRDLDFLVLQVNSFQLEMTRYFRPAVAVLLNLSPDHLHRYGTLEQYIRANARVFQNQQAFDWTIVQTEALAQLTALGISPPSKVVTFSATDQQSDLYLDRGLIISRLANWSGPLLDMDQCQLRGPHNAENFMAALAVGHALRLALDAMRETLKAQPPAPHRFELVAEINGVQFINDSKATNVDALHKALLAVPPAPGGKPNVFLIAGGKDKGLAFHDVGPVLTRRVKGAFLIGEAREKIRAAWSLFTPCTLAGSLLEAISEAAKIATAGDVVLLSPACSSFDQFEGYQHRGEIFCQAVKSIGSGARDAHPNINDKNE